jgi:hypothetical protein
MLKAKLNSSCNSIPDILRGIVLVLLVGVSAYGFFSILAVILNCVSELLRYDVRGMVYFFMFLFTVFAYVKLGQYLFKSCRVSKRSKWMCIAVTEVFLFLLQPVFYFTGIPLFGFLASWVGGVGYLILYLFSFISMPNGLIFTLCYAVGLCFPALFIGYYCKEV